jgi:hypothetical protein
MRAAIAIAALALGTLACFPAHARIEGPQDAVEAAKRYTKARCTTAQPCTYKAQRDGKRWRVWVTPKRRPGKSEPTLVLYFDAEGNLIRRLEVD